MSTISSVSAATRDAARRGSAAVAPDVPRKFIDADHTRLDVFRRSASFAAVLCYVQACAMSVCGVAYTSRRPRRVDECCPAVRYVVQELFPQLHAIVDAIPLEDMAQQRFGNRAKRVFHARLDAVAVTLMTQLARTLPSMQRRRRQQQRQQHDTTDDTTHGHNDDEAAVHALAIEMAAYLKDAFGNATRLDYGTGHELHFVMLMIICLAEHGDTGAPLLYTQQHEEQQQQQQQQQQRATATQASDKAHGNDDNNTNNNNNNNNDNRRSAPRTAAYELFGLPANIAAPAPLPADTAVSLGDADNNDNNDTITLHALRQQFVFYVFYEYMRFVRRLQTHYSLEPAGSHGAWGLDDYHHLPYIFGAAQLIGAETGRSNNNDNNNSNSSNNESNNDNDSDSSSSCAHATTAIVPADVCDAHKVARYADAYMYFAMVQWVLTHKSGPFAEHSNMLYNISGVGRWAKIYGGMVKMYAAEVLSKFNVAQHILFGRHFPWNTTRLPL